MAALIEGKKAPSFKGKDQNGKMISLSDFKGQNVVLYFYPQDDTPTCTVQACNLRDNYEGLIKAGYVVFGVSSDTEKSHQKFIDKQSLPFSLIADTDLTVHHAFGTWVEKSMYGRAYMGTARTTFVIDEAGKLAEIIEKVDTKNHTAQVLK